MPPYSNTLVFEHLDTLDPQQVAINTPLLRSGSQWLEVMFGYGVSWHDMRPPAVTNGGTTRWMNSEPGVQHANHRKHAVHAYGRRLSGAPSMVQVCEVITPPITGAKFSSGFLLEGT